MQRTVILLCCIGLFYGGCMGGKSYNFIGDLCEGDEWTAPSLSYESDTFWDFTCANSPKQKSKYQKITISFPAREDPITVKVTSLFEFPDDTMILVFNSTSSEWKPNNNQPCTEFVNGVYKIPQFEIPHTRVGISLSAGNFTFVISGKSSSTKAGKYSIQIMEADYHTSNVDPSRTWSLQDRTTDCSYGSALYGVVLWTILETQRVCFDVIFLDTSIAVYPWQVYSISTTVPTGAITNCVYGIQTEAFSPIPNYGYHLAYGEVLTPQTITVFASGNSSTQIGPYAGWIREPDDVYPLDNQTWNGPSVPFSSSTEECQESSFITKYQLLHFKAEYATYFFAAGSPYNYDHAGLSTGPSNTHLALYQGTFDPSIEPDACSTFLVASDAGNGVVLVVSNLTVSENYTLVVYSNSTYGRSVYRMTGESVSKISSKEKSKENSNAGAIAGGVIGAFVGVVILAAIVLFLIKRRNTKKYLQRNRSQSIGLSQKEVTKVSNIEIQEKLGKGNFGEVYKGLWNGTTVVALKKLHEVDQMKDFYQEARMLETLKHPNVLSYIGIYNKGSDQYIVTEFMSKGSLDKLLPMEKSTITVLDMVKMHEISMKSMLILLRALQAAAGMVYLEQQHVIHRDLSLRNLLVSPSGDSDKYRIKIADFGLSRETQQGNYYTVNSTVSFPVKWTAPEILLYPNNKFTSRCDVWSFGVLLWELFSYGATPYLGMSNSEAAEKVADGYRLSQPKICPDGVYSLMSHCWNENSEERPTFKVMSRWKEVLTKKEIHKELMKVKSSLSSESDENANNNNNVENESPESSFYKDDSQLKKPLPSVPNSNQNRESSFYKAENL